jgi:integrase
MTATLNRQRKQTAQSRTTSHLPWTQAQSLLKCLTADNQHNTALMCAAGLYFGLRIGDILQLRWKDILQPSFTIHEQKTGKRRKIKVHPDFALIRDAALQQMPEHRRPQPQQFVFVSQEPRGNRRRPISRQAANKRFKKALQAYGIETANPSSHTLRKTFGRRVWNKNGKSEAALVLLGEIFNHRSITVTRKYLGITADEIAQAYLSL